MGLFDGLAGALFGGQAAKGIQNPVTSEQVTGGYANTQTGLAGQQNLIDQQNQAGAGNVYGSQQALLQALMQQSQGMGPNPAQAQLAQNTSQNMAQQSALMAGQRGVSSNVGLAARQTAMQGANIQQQSVGQAATLGAQQQLAAQQMAAQQQAQIAGQAQQSQNAYGQQAQGQYGTTIAGMTGQNTVNAGMQQSQNEIIGGVLNGIGGAAANMFSAGAGGTPSAGGAGGGFTPKAFANGGEVPNSPQSIIGQHFKNFKGGGQVPGKAQVAGDSLKNDTVSAVLSPGEIVIPRSILSGPNAPAKAAAFVKAHLAKKGK